jgi:hypothetical protein
VIRARDFMTVKQEATHSLVDWQRGSDRTGRVPVSGDEAVR